MADVPTRLRLLNAAIDHFGRLGLHGASTRAIAREADTPMSSITYHFGGKEGLYLAAADHIASEIARRAGPALEQVRAMCAEPPTPAVARNALHLVFAHMVGVIVSPETAAFARFILREQADPTEAFTHLYSGAMRELLARLAALLRTISHDRLGEQDSRLKALTLMGQLLVFRVARAAVLATTGWREVGAAEVDEIRRSIADNLEAICDRLEAGGQR